MKEIFGTIQGDFLRRINDILQNQLSVLSSIFDQHSQTICRVFLYNKKQTDKRIIIRFKIRMSSVAEKALIKTEIINSLTSLGFHDQLKKELRIRICQKLKQKNLVKSNLDHEDKLYHRIMSSLVSQFLLKNDCAYSNSIYVAESGYDMKTLERLEIQELLGFKVGDADSNYSILQSIVKKRYPFSGGSLRSISIQTNPEDIGLNLQQRLSLIDQQYRNNIATKRTGGEQFTYKKKLEQLEYQLKRNYQRDIQRFREFQGHNIKIKVSQQWRKRFEEYARNISDDYRRKMQHLRKRERFMEDQMVNKNKVLDEKVNGTHKTLIQKLDILDIKSSTVDQTRRNLQIERKRVKQQYIEAQKDLKKKIKEYDSLLLNLNEKIKYEVGIAKLSIQQQYQQKNQQFLLRKRFIDEEYGKLMGIKDASDLIRDENKRLFDENMRLRKDLTDIQKQFRLSVSESAEKGERLDSLRAQVYKLEKEKNQKQEVIKQLNKRYKRKQEEIIELRKQVDELRDWKQRQVEYLMKQQSSLNLDDDEKQRPGVSPLAEAKTELETKLDLLKRQRKKEIERLKLQLL